MKSPLFSIITPTYNSESKLARTVSSVLSQSFAEFEYLFVDGASTDGTCADIKAYLEQDHKVQLISEPDEGIYDAMNKGIRASTGEFLYFLGAGDRLQPGALEAVAVEIQKLRSSGKTLHPLMLYGDVSWSRYKRPYDGHFSNFKLLRRNICHQAIFYERSLFQRHGYYDTAYQVLADYAFNIRCFRDPGVDKRYLPLLIADYEDDGISTAVRDDVFHAHLRQLVRRDYGLITAMTLHLFFLFTHPRALVREPFYRLRRFLSAYNNLA